MNECCSNAELKVFRTAEEILKGSQSLFSQGCKGVTDGVRDLASS
jgi:hypothetical protein